MKQNSSIGEVETWLEGLKTYKSVENPRKTYSHHVNGTIRDSQPNHTKEAKQPIKMV